MRLFQQMNLTKLRAHPKLFVGYSDLTSLHLALENDAGIVTFHGPNLTRRSPRLDAISSQEFWRLLEEPGPHGVLPTGAATITTLVQGLPKAKLQAGTSAWWLTPADHALRHDFKHKIVLIEDVGEAVYRADRFLTQLHNAGLLQQAAGFVIGTITNWRAQEKDPPRNSPKFTLAASAGASRETSHLWLPVWPLNLTRSHCRSACAHGSTPTMQH